MPQQRLHCSKHDCKALPSKAHTMVQTFYSTSLDVAIRYVCHRPLFTSMRLQNQQLNTKETKIQAFCGFSSWLHALDSTYTNAELQC